MSGEERKISNDYLRRTRKLHETNYIPEMQEPYKMDKHLGCSLCKIPLATKITRKQRRKKNNGMDNSSNIQVICRARRLGHG